MDMKKILQAVDGISARPVEGADSMARFLRVVKEAEINQPAAIPQSADNANITPAIKPYVHAPGPDDPNFDRYVDLMWRYEFLDNERTGKANLIKVDVGVSDEANAEIDRLKYEAEKLAGPNLPAWEKARIGYQTDPEYIKYSQDMAAKMSAELLEAEINQPAAKKPGMPTADEINKIKASIPQLPAQDGDLGDGVRVQTNQDGTRSYKSGAGTYTYDAQGKAITYTSPRMSGFGQTLDLTTNEITLDYHAGPISTTGKADAQGRGTSFGLKYDLGGGQYHSLDAKTDHASGITSTTLTPGGGVDPNELLPTAGVAARRGVDPAKFAAFQKQNPTAVKENSLSKFLSIVRKNDVSILKESANPHRVALPVQMAMQHYQQPATKPQPRERLIDKYFVEAETEITQRREEKRALINQYAKTIAERVLMKEAANPAQQAAIAVAKKKKKQSMTEGDVPNDPNKLTASMLMGGEYKELDLTPLIAKNNWVGTPKQVINQADKWLSDFLRQRGNMYSNLKIKYKGLTMTSSKIGDVDASDTEFESIAGVGLQPIDELSTELLGKYKKAAGTDAKAADAAGDFERGNKRFSGIVKATKKQFDNDAKKHKALDEANDPAQFAKPPQVPQVPAKDGMYGSWEFTTRKDGDRSATHPQYGTFVWDNSGAGGALRPITWSLPSNSIPGMSWVTDFVSGTHTLEYTLKLGASDLELNTKLHTKLDGTNPAGSVGLKGRGHEANFTSANGKATGTYKDPDGKETSWDVPPEPAGEVKQEGLDQLLALRNKIDEAIKQRRKGGTASRGIDKHIGEGKTK